MLHSEIEVFERIGVIGCGAWGTALAMQGALKAKEVLIYCREKEIEASVNNEHENIKHLHGVKLLCNIKATCDLNDLQNMDLLLIAIPAQRIRQFLSDNHEFKFSNPVLLCSKGIEDHTLKCLSDVVVEFWDANVMVLSGPNFANEVVKGKISATTIASSNEALGVKAAHTFHSHNFRVYRSDDVIGVQILGAVKNVIAIAAGISIGLALGENSKAALITRGVHEACQLLQALGGQMKTALGLAGIGDMLLTATSITSRNTELGCKIGRGVPIKEIINSADGKTIEGYYSCKALYKIGKEHHLDLPIINSLHDILYENLDLQDAINIILQRSSGLEWDIRG